MLKQTHNQQINLLQRELELLRSLVIGTLGRDKEGDYNPSFVKNILKTAGEKPTRKFENKETFLKQLT